MIRVTAYRKAKTPPMGEYARADEDCIWDTQGEPEYDSEGYEVSEYGPCGSYPMTFWEEQLLAWA